MALHHGLAADWSSVGNCQVSFHRGHNIIQTAANQIHPASQQAHGHTGKSWINLEKHGNIMEQHRKFLEKNVECQCSKNVFLSSFALIGFRLGFEKASEATLSKALQTSVKVGKSPALSYHEAAKRLVIWHMCK